MRAWVYLGLSLSGLGLTWFHNLAFAREAGTMDLGAFVAAAGVNHAAQSIGWDVTVAAITFCFFAVVEGKRVGVKWPWAYVVLTFGVALAFAAPLFLCMRERALLAAGDAPPAS